MTDMCKGCKIPDRAEKLDPYESEYYLSCANRVGYTCPYLHACTDCACYTCPHLHACYGQCVEGGI